MLKIKRNNLQNYGEAVHSSLRKIGSSKMTSLAYNAIDLLSDETWSEHVFAMQKKLKNKTFKSTGVFFSFIEDETIEFFGAASELIIDRAACNILRIAFTAFDDGDWQCYCGFLTPLATVRKKKKG